jgi:cob(I)alamin adenosyltransferase
MTSMVKLTKIYTRGGDKGQTSLGDGSRVTKHSARPSAYGTVDETNAVIGLARLTAKADGGAKADEMLARIQNDLFDLGADLCTPEDPDPKYPPLRISDAQVERLEAEIDQTNGELQPLNSFILPGGCTTSAQLHLARTIARRAEREITAAIEAGEEISAAALKYINRLSDHLFVLSRYLNDKGKSDVLWVPGQNR